jgi:hypothetical protein
MKRRTTSKLLAAGALSIGALNACSSPEKHPTSGPQLQQEFANLKAMIMRNIGTNTLHGTVELGTCALAVDTTSKGADGKSMVWLIPSPIFVDEQVDGNTAMRSMVFSLQGHYYISNPDVATSLNGLDRASGKIPKTHDFGEKFSAAAAVKDTSHNDTRNIKVTAANGELMAPEGYYIGTALTTANGSGSYSDALITLQPLLTAGVCSEAFSLQAVPTASTVLGA